MEAERRPQLTGLIAFASLLATIGISAPGAAQSPPSVKPSPQISSATDEATIQAVQAVNEAVERRDWSRAWALAGKIDAPVGRSLAQWIYFQGQNPLVSIVDVDAFLDAHGDWPLTGRIQTFAEKRMSTNTSASQILAFFDTRDPVTGEGKVQLSRALFAMGESEAGELQIRDAWRRHNFVLADEQNLLARFGGVLTTDDHVFRADRLLWARDAASARRVLSKLPPRERRLAEARAALLLGAENAASIFDALSAEDRADAGVLHAAVRYFRRRGEEPRALALAATAPTEPALLRNPVRLWEERQLLMRWALTEKQYANAYRMASGHGLETGSEFAEAEFNAGWIALRFLNQPERAQTHFTALAGGVTAPISRSRAFYWLGRAAEALGDDALAERRYRQAASYIFTYYGQLAAERLGGPLVQQSFPPPTLPTPDDNARFNAMPLVAALRLLINMGDDSQFLAFAHHIDDQLKTPGEFVELMRLAEQRGATHAIVRAGKVAVGKGATAPELAYPLIDVPKGATRFAPSEVILGLSRQESEFNPRAYSSAGARGIMQLLPTTAEITAKKEGLRYSRSALLTDADYNITLGAAHLSHLLTRFNGSYAMTFAAYNAGSLRVDQWIERYGDPRADGVDPVDWVEQIPFAETRNYVQRVLENTQVYRSRLTTSAPIAGKLSFDLERGGDRGRAGRLAAVRGGDLPPIPPRTVMIASLAAIDPSERTPEIRFKPAETEIAAQTLPSDADATAASIDAAAPEVDAPNDPDPEIGAASERTESPADAAN